MSNTNCLCNKKTITNFCLPKIDYKNLYQDANGRLNDFRLCPLRFKTTIYLIEQLEIKYNKFSYIATKCERIKMFRKILTKDFKLRKEDCCFILKDYMEQEDNLINNKKTIECDECCVNINIKKDKYKCVDDTNDTYLCHKCFI